MGLSFGLSLAICMLVPFPISIVVILAVFILLSFCMGRRMMKNMGIGGKVGMFGGSDDGILKYYCICCGTAHREPACPKCGSRMKSGILINYYVNPLRV